MNIIHYYALGLSHASGVTAALRDWSEAFAAREVEAKLICAEGGLSEEYYSIDVQTLPHYGRGRSTFLPKLKLLGDAFREADLIVLHEGWTASNAVAAAVARKHSVPYILMPHGVYEPQVMEGLRFRRLRGTLEKLILNSAAGVHIFWSSERRVVLDLCPDITEFVVAPTGLPEMLTLSAADTVRSDFYLWFGRMDVYHKGLDILLEALSLIEGSVRPRLVLAGYDYTGGRSELNRQIERYQLAGSVSVVGSIVGDEKADYLQKCIAYLHPSRWECHSIALLEVLRSETPAIVSAEIHAAGPLSDLGVIEKVENNPQSWAKRLTQAPPEPPKAAQLEFLNWDNVAPAALAQYSAILGTCI